MIAKQFTTKLLFLLLIALGLLGGQFVSTALTASATGVSPDDDDDGDFDDDDDGAGQTEIYGIIDSYPTNLIGTWVIDGVSYSADNTTRFEQDHGPFAVGACVELKYDPATNIAFKIETDDCNGDDDNGQFNRVYGTIESFPAGLIGIWVVNGVSYNTTSATQFDQSDGAFAVGRCIELDYLPSTNVAFRIETENETYHCGGSDGGGGHHGNDFERYGQIDSFPAGLIGTWVIDGISYEAGTGTQFEQEDGAFAVGRCVEVKYLSSFVALEIETESGYHCGGSGGSSGSYQELYGTVDSFPASLTGTWVIDGVSYSADNTTYFEQDDGAFTVGGCVEIKFQTANSLALKIETEDPYHCGGSTTPPGDEAPSFAVNHNSGANGSAFVFVGDNLQADSAVQIRINGQLVTPFGLTDSNGSVTFAVNDTAQRTSATTYSVEVIINGQQLSESIEVVANQPVWSLPANYSAPTLDLANLQAIHQLFLPTIQR